MYVLVSFFNFSQLDLELCRSFFLSCGWRRKMGMEGALFEVFRAAVCLNAGTGAQGGKYANQGGKSVKKLPFFG